MPQTLPQPSAVLLEESWTSLSTSFLDVISSTPSKLATALSTTTTTIQPASAAPKDTTALPTSTSSNASPAAQALTDPIDTPSRLLNAASTTPQTPQSPFKPASDHKATQILPKSFPVESTSIDASQALPSDSSIALESSLALPELGPGEEDPTHDKQISSTTLQSALPISSIAENGFKETHPSLAEPESSDNIDFESFDEPSSAQQILSASTTQQANLNQQDFGNWDSDPWGDDFGPSSEASPPESRPTMETVAPSTNASSVPTDSSSVPQGTGIDEQVSLGTLDAVIDASSPSEDPVEDVQIAHALLAPAEPPSSSDGPLATEALESILVTQSEPLEQTVDEAALVVSNESPSASTALPNALLIENVPSSSMDTADETSSTNSAETASKPDFESELAEASPLEPLRISPLAELSEAPMQDDTPHLIASETDQLNPTTKEPSTPSKFEPSAAPSTSGFPSDSSQIRHLQSKLDVLSRILEERERQLSARSSTMAEVQNENAHLKSELEIFRSAQAKIKAPSTSGTQLTLIDALAEEFGERIGAMETKYRSCFKEREKLSEQLKLSTQQLDATNAQISAMSTELEGYRTGKPVATSTTFTAPPSTPSRLLGQVFNPSSLSTPNESNNSLIDSAFSSISSLLTTPSQSDLKQPPTPQLSTPSSTQPLSSDSTESIAEIQHSTGEATSIPNAPTLEEELRAEGLVLQEKLQRYEGLVRQLKAREKSHLAEIKQLESKVASLSLELQSHANDKQSAESESTRARESEKKLKSAMEAQKDALEIKAKQLMERMSAAETLERESTSLKSELESSWRLNESLRKELEQNRIDSEQARQQLEARYQSLNLEASAALVSKSAQQQQMLQNTIDELRAALDGNKTLKSTQEEALEARVLDLETALLSTEQHLTMSRQTAELAQSPLLKQISDLQTQLAHQQRALEVVEEAWKARAQDLETSLTSSSQDLTSAQSQIRSAEMSTHKIQAQYARLEHQHQTLQIEFDQLTLESAALESDKETLETALDNIKASNSSLTAKLSGSNAKTDELLAEQKETISKLEAQVSALNQRISSLTTPGYSSSSNLALSHANSLQSSTGSVASPSTSRGHSPTASLVGTSSMPSLNHPPVHTPQKSAHTATAMETQLSLLRTEKSRAEEMLAEALHTSSKAESLEASLRAAEEEKTGLQERLDAALELVAEQSERLQFSDEEVAETKQLYKHEIANLVAQLAEMQDKISHLQGPSSPSK